MTDDVNTRPTARELYERSSKPDAGPTLDEIVLAIMNEIPAEAEALMRAALAVRRLFSTTTKGKTD